MKRMFSTLFIIKINITIVTGFDTKLAQAAVLFLIADQEIKYINGHISFHPSPSPHSTFLIEGLIGSKDKFSKI